MLLSEFYIQNRHVHAVLLQPRAAAIYTDTDYYATTVLLLLK